MPLDSEQRNELRRLLEVRRESLSGGAGTAEATGAAAPKKPKKAVPAAKADKKRTRKKDPIEVAAAHELNEACEALKRLKEQEHRFGYCEHCFMEIPWGELVANPARRCCSRCS